MIGFLFSLVSNLLKTALFTQPLRRLPLSWKEGMFPIPQDCFFKKKLGKMDIHPSSSSFSHMQALARNHAADCINQAFSYENEKWDKSHTEQTFKVGDQVLVSTQNFNNLAANQKLKDPFIGPFPVIELVGRNALRVELHGAFARRHPFFPVSLIKMYKESNKQVFPGRELRKKKLPPIDEEHAVIDKVLNKWVVKNGSMKELQFLVSFKNQPSDTEGWLSEKDIPDAGRVLQNFRVETRRKND